MSPEKTKRASGHCLCGAVAFEVHGPLTEAHACHCGQCRRQSGHFVVATGAKREDVRFLTQSTLKWFQSSETARRGFCGACGSALFWDDGGPELSINAGCLDAPTGLSVTAHIFVADKGDYYEIADNLEQFEGFGGES